MLLRVLILASLVGTLYGQTVSGQATTSSPPQTVTATLTAKKVANLVMVLSCPTVPPCASATSTATSCMDTNGALLLLPGASGQCLFTLTNGTVGAASLSLPITSSDTTQITVPATVTFAAGASVSAAFAVTATTP